VKYLPENSSDGKKRRQSSKPEPPELLPFMVSYISCNINIKISKDVMDFSYKQKKSEIRKCRVASDKSNVIRQVGVPPCQSDYKTQVI
jgi:hypothetical protein